ncbi:hypothetical protein [Streptomyces sp. URMC 129]|uniref:hypothetical protein n=1 Tax=Streptomyces sp. URMC 129 TaxID=3423407 RepID=UPI003F1B54EA
MMERVACPHCGQDWLRLYRRNDTQQTFWLCPECESLWLPSDDLQEDTELYLSEFINPAERGTAWMLISEVEK